jgi:hypothetical protein
MIYIPIGISCKNAIDLKEQNLRKASYPFDWIVTTPKSLVYWIKNDFKGFFNIDGTNNNLVFYRRDLEREAININHEKLASNQISNWVIRDFKSNFLSVHDLIKLEDFPKVQETYKRRIDRFNKVLSSNEPVTFKWTNHIYNVLWKHEIIEGNERKVYYSKQDLLSSGFEDLIKKKYPNLEFKIDIDDSFRDIRNPFIKNAWGQEDITNK